MTKLYRKDHLLQMSTTFWVLEITIFILRFSKVVTWQKKSKELIKYLNYKILITLITVVINWSYYKMSPTLHKLKLKEISELIYSVLVDFVKPTQKQLFLSKDAKSKYMYMLTILFKWKHSVINWPSKRIII